MATPNIVPRSDSEGGLGTASKYWASAYIDNVFVSKIGRDAHNLIDFSTDNQVTFRCENNNKFFLNGSRVAPSSNDGLALGAPTGGWSDLFLAEGAVINFNNGNVVLTHSNNHLTISDNDAIGFGNANDLKIYHDGSDNYIKADGLGHLYIQQGLNDGDIIFSSDDGSGGITAYLTIDGSAGRTVVSKQMRFEDNVDLAFGGGTDLRLYHDPNNSFIVNNTGNLIIENSADDADIVFKCDDGSGGTAEYFRVDGGAKQTRISEEFNFLDSVKATFGAGGDMYLEHDSTNSVIVNTNGNLTISNQADDKDILFKCDNGSGGVTTYITIDGSVTTTKFNKQTLYPDSVEAIFGDGSDLKIKHDGTTSEIRNTEGNLKIRNFADDKDIIFETDDGSGSTTTYLQLDGSEVSTKILTQKVIMSNLPTSDPGNSGQLWNDNGTLKISVG